MQSATGTLGLVESPKRCNCPCIVSISGHMSYAIDALKHTLLPASRDVLGLCTNVMTLSYCFSAHSIRVGGWDH
jgi:hypothetical protein